MNQEKFINTCTSLIVVMGVSGSGKSHVASKLSTKLGFNFVEADDFHSEEAKRSMAANVPITDEVRQIWFDLVCHHLKKNTNKNTILAFSGLKYKHRQGLRSLMFNTQFILLHGKEEIIKQRLNERVNHFVSSDFLSGQLKAMESPQVSENDIIKINVDGEIDKVLTQCLQSVVV
jgi:gluconokinase